MMVMKAKFAGRCTLCGGKIDIGDEINWEKGEGARHVECPECPEPVEERPRAPRQMAARFDGTCAECGNKINAGDAIYYQKGKGAWHVDCTAAKEKAEKVAAELKAAAPYRVSDGSGYGGDSFTEGEVIRASRNIMEQGGPEYLYVVRAGEQYVREDGLSFGVGDESGYIFWADCREATAEEAAPLIERSRRIAEKKAAGAELKKLTKEIIKNGERPEGHHIPEGVKMCEKNMESVIYGGGSWFVVGADYIWYVENNGSDGGDWSLNNVRTSGAGAIGWRVAFTQEFADRLAAIDEIVRRG